MPLWLSLFFVWQKKNLREKGARLIPAAILLALNFKALPALHTRAFISIRKDSVCIQYNR